MKFLNIFLLTTSLLLGIQANLSASQSYYDYYKKLKYEASLAYTKLGQNAWWTEIAPFKIYLGALPLLSEGHLDQIQNLGVTRVLSMVEDFEVEDGWLNTPVKPQDWTERGIAVKHIQAEDFLPLKREEIDEGVAFLSQSLDEGHTVYVHCKAGRGRSASIVIVYLMQSQNLSFDEAFALVKELRPQINLNTYQQQAISDYFAQDVDDTLTHADEEKGVSQQISEITEEKLALLLDQMLFYVIEGVSYESENLFPEYLSTWIPAVEVQSTLERRNRYLREYRGDQKMAVEAAIERNHGLIRRFKLMAANAVPFIGSPTSYTISLWHQLREIALIAALHGHDLSDPEVKMKVLNCLVDGNLLKIPALSVDFIARKIVKQIVLEMGLSSALPSVIPSQWIFNFFTSNSAKVATHAKEVFGGENSLFIAEEDYR